MKTIKGLWIDRHKAVVVAVTDHGDKVSKILSQVEKHIGRITGGRSITPHEARKVPADDSSERGGTEQLDIFYDEVVANLRDAEEIMIFGPDDAKGELMKRIERDPLHGHIARIETAKNMTDTQIKAKVRKYFHDSGSMQ